MDARKKLVWATLSLTLLLLIGGVLYKLLLMVDPIVIDTTGQPTIGTGKIEVVLFEDLCCKNCRVFAEEVLPQITSQYVETGKARLTVFPISFGEKSKPLANAALAVYKITPGRFISFLLGLLHDKASMREEILAVASKVGGIDLRQLAMSIDHRLYYKEVDQNLIYAKMLMGDDFGTPTLFVNGIETSTESFRAFSRRMQQVEGN